jgi:hypothetical protein
MSKHREIGRTPRTSARQYMATGVSGVALIGVGVPTGCSSRYANRRRPIGAADVLRLGVRSPTVVPSTTTPWWLNGGGTGGSTGANGTGGNGGTGGGGSDGGPGSSGHTPGSGANTGTNPGNDHDGAEGGAGARAGPVPRLPARDDRPHSALGQGAARSMSLRPQNHQRGPAVTWVGGYVSACGTCVGSSAASSSRLSVPVLVIAL